MCILAVQGHPRSLILVATCAMPPFRTVLKRSCLHCTWEQFFGTHLTNSSENDLKMAVFETIFNNVDKFASCLSG